MRRADRRLVAGALLLALGAGGVWLHRRLAPPDTSPWDGPIAAAAAEFGVDPLLVHAVVAAESRGDARAVSRAGARGLMQLMLPTAREQAERLGLPAPAEADLFEGPLNVRLGTSYLARLLRLYDGEVVYALAAYNAGMGRVARWRAAQPEAPPDEVLAREGFAETRAYVAKVLRLRDHYARAR